MSLQALEQQLKESFADKILESKIATKELTIEVAKDELISIATELRDNQAFQFGLLIDVCGVDYLEYGQSEWATEQASSTGFERGVHRHHKEQVIPFAKPRFAVVYHLLSVTLNQRLRVKVFLEEDSLLINSVIDVWPAANWFEREAFDLFGIVFVGHPDLRRILTDYGFVGHPFRKDFPLIGEVEMRYDAAKGRVVYHPVSIEPRILVPKVIREDSRYNKQEQGGEHV